jgi:hypothetical protein
MLSVDLKYVLFRNYNVLYVKTFELKQNVAFRGEGYIISIRFHREVRQNLSKMFNDNEFS